MCAFLLASNSAHAQVESNSQEIEITRLTKEKQLLTLRKEVESLRKEVSVAEDPLLQEAARRQATNTVLSALATSEVQADVAKIEAIKTLAGSTKAGKAGSVTVGTDSVTVIPIGGLADDSAFEEVAGNLCKKLRSINSNKIALIAPAGYPTDAALFKANFENLQSAAATARLMVPEGRSLLADLAIQSKIETKARKILIVQQAQRTQSSPQITMPVLIKVCLLLLQRYL